MTRAGWRAALCCAMSCAAHESEALDSQFSVRAAGWSSSLNLDEQENLVPLQAWARSSAALPLGASHLHFYGEGWVETQAQGRDQPIRGRVREAYAQLSVGSFELRGGWQMFPWGRADAINPTDNLTPRDLTFLTRDTEDQRFGTPALRGTWFKGPLAMNLIWLPGFRATVLPWPSGAPSLRDSDPSNRAAQWATRLEWVRGDFEGSLSYFDGYDILPSQALVTSVLSRSVRVVHERLKIGGGDFAKVIGRTVVRGELAHTETAAPSYGTASFIKQPQWYVVVGGEHTFGTYLNLNVQYYYRQVAGTSVPQGLPAAVESIGSVFAIMSQQYDRTDRGVTVRVADQWFNETLEASLSGVYSLERSGYLLRPLIKYRATDAWTVSMGADVFHGSERSFYGLLKNDTTAYVELRWGF